MADSDTTPDEGTTSDQNNPGFNWGQVLDTTPARTPASAPAQSYAAAPRGGSLPPFPPNTGTIVGRLPIRGDTGRAVLQLPEPLEDLHCAVVMVNSGVASDCNNRARNRCVPVALRGNPINDREIEVFLDGDGDHVAIGPGWTPGQYQGAQPETRQVETGVPYVEVLAVVGVDCGCDSENWHTGNDWG